MTAQRDRQIKRNRRHATELIDSLSDCSRSCQFVHRFAPLRLPPSVVHLRLRLTFLSSGLAYILNSMSSASSGLVRCGGGPCGKRTGAQVQTETERRGKHAAPVSAQGRGSERLRCGAERVRAGGEGVIAVPRPLLRVCLPSTGPSCSLLGFLRLSLTAMCGVLAAGASDMAAAAAGGRVRRRQPGVGGEGSDGPGGSGGCC
jgi:hypothetical protein